MKKHISLILLASMAVTLFTGCRETPDATAELQKDQEQMLQTAEQGRDNSALLAALDVPERFTGEWEGVNGLVHVTADAEIILPDTDAIPTGSVIRRDFTQEDLDTFLRVFMKGQPFYEEVIMTKQEALAKLEEYRAMERGDIPLSGDTTDEKLSDVIAYYTELASTAPDEGELRPAATSFTSDGTVENMSGWSEIDGRKTHLWVQNFPGAWDSAVWYVQDYGDVNNSYCQPYSAVPDDIAKEPPQPDISEEEAVKMGNALLAELGFKGLVCDQITPVYFADAMWLQSVIIPGNTVWDSASYWQDLDRAILDTGYQMQYVRSLNGFPIGYTGIEGTYVEEGNEMSVWPYESIEVCVTKDGVVYFKWTAPTEEPVIELENTQLMSFDEISSVFERMIMVRHSYAQTINDNGGDGDLSIDIDKVRLNLMRVRPKSSNDMGLLIPVWDYYGSEGPIEETIVLTINAIDGSMVSRELGY